MSHSGMDTGFQSNFLIIPEKELGLVWMTNNDFAPMKMLTEGLLDIVHGYDEKEIKYSLAMTLVKAMADGKPESAVETYKSIKENCMDKYYTEENEFNILAYGLCRENRINEAVKILEIAISELPMADNLYDSLGEMHLKNNNKEMAVKNFKIAVELNPKNKGAVKALEELEIK